MWILSDLKHMYSSYPYYQQIDTSLYNYIVLGVSRWLFLLLLVCHLRGRIFL